MFSLNKIKQAMVLSVALTATFSLSGCGESSSSEQGEQFGGSPQTPPTTPTQFNQKALLESVANNVILPTYKLFADNTVSLSAAISGYCDAQRASSNDTASWKTQSQQQWQDAMVTWQMAEMMQIGPLLENNSNLRNKIYSWPNTSSCAVDQDVVLSEQADYDIATRTVSRKGLDALEYLLFNDTLDHSCTSFGSEPVGWDARTDEQKVQARCAYAEKVAADLTIQAQVLLNAWEGDDNSGYKNIFINAGEPGNAFTDAQAAVNDISDAMFYIDSATKDAKLAAPLGIIANDCGLSVCPENVESPYAQHSLQNITANIKALNLLFKGGESSDAVGFDDYLVDVGDSDTALQMTADLTQALEYAQSLQNTLTHLLENNPDSARTLHGEVKDVTDKMKADFIQSLSLELPATSAGDND